MVLEQNVTKKWEFTWNLASHSSHGGFSVEVVIMKAGGIVKN